MAVVRFQSLDHNLLLSQQLIDAQTDPPTVAFDHHDQPFSAVAGATGMRVEMLLESKYRQVLAAEGKHFAVSDHLADRGGTHLQRLDDSRERHDVGLVADGNC